MDIRLLKTLIAIVDYKTFAAAGNAVGRTQSAVSQQVRKIEDELQIKLFDRTTRPPKLTARGHSLIAGARDIVAQYERITSAISKDRLSGNLALGTIPTAVTGLLPEALSILRDRYPHLRIQVKTGYSADLVPMVNTGQLDAAIVAEQPVRFKGLRWSPFAIETLMVIAPDFAKEKSDRELLEAHPFIRYQRKVQIAQTIDDEIQRRGINVKEDMQIDSFASILLMVRQGLGVSVVPAQGAHKPFSKGIRAAAFGSPPIQRFIGIVDKEMSSTKPVVDALHSELRRLSGSLEN